MLEEVIKEFRKNKWMADEFVMIDSVTYSNIEQFLLKIRQKDRREFRKILNKKIDREVKLAIKNGNVNFKRMYELVKEYKKQKKEFKRVVEEERNYWIKNLKNDNDPKHTLYYKCKIDTLSGVLKNLIPL